MKKIPNSKNQWNNAIDLTEIEKDIAEGKNISPAFDNADDMIAWLKKPEK